MYCVDWYSYVASSFVLVDCEVTIKKNTGRLYMYIECLKLYKRTLGYISYKCWDIIKCSLVSLISTDKK